MPVGIAFRAFGMAFRFIGRAFHPLPERLTGTTARGDAINLYRLYRLFT
jgi:hypothetical protein